MSYNYVTYYALTDGQRRVARFCFRFGLGALVLCGGGLLVAANAFAKPAGVEPSSWPWTPADGYALACTALFTLSFVGAAAFAFALRQYWVDWKVKRQSEGISGLYNFLSFAAFVLGLIGVVFLARVTYVGAYVVPTRGWPEGPVWSRGFDSEVTNVGFSDDGATFYVRTSGYWPAGSSRGTPLVGGGALYAFSCPGGLSRTPAMNVNLGPQSRRRERSAGTPLAVSAGAWVVQAPSSGSTLTLSHQFGATTQDLPLDGTARCLAVTGDGQKLVSGDDSGLVRVFDLSTAGRDFDPNGGVRTLYDFRHGAAVTCVTVSPEGLFAASAGEDGMVHVWDLTVGVERRGLGRAGEGRLVRQVALCTGAYRAVTVETDGTYSSREELVLWDVSLGKEIKRLTLHEYNNATDIRLALSPDGRYALATTGTNIVRLWRLPER
jgi:hypothetical protein